MRIALQGSPASSAVCLSISDFPDPSTTTLATLISSALSLNPPLSLEHTPRDVLASVRLLIGGTLISLLQDEEELATLRTIEQTPEIQENSNIWVVVLPRASSPPPTPPSPTNSAALSILVDRANIDDRPVVVQPIVPALPPTQANATGDIQAAVIQGLYPDACLTEGGVDVHVSGHRLRMNQTDRLLLKFGQMLTAPKVVVSDSEIICVAPAHPPGPVTVEVALSLSLSLTRTPLAVTETID